MIADPTSGNSGVVRLAQDRLLHARAAGRAEIENDMQGKSFNFHKRNLRRKGDYDRVPSYHIQVISNVVIEEVQGG